MDKLWEDDNCENIRSLYTAYSVPEAAARWCGVPEDSIEQVLKEIVQISSTGGGRGVYKHPQILCIEPRTRAIAQAIEDSTLLCGREDGVPVSGHDHVAYERRHVIGKDLRAWMQKELPNEKPEFLFDELDRQKSSSITPDDYLVLKAKNDALEERLKKAEKWYRSNKEVSTQGHNSYQRVIQTLSEMVLKAPLSGVPNTDAVSVIEVVERKGKVMPVDQRTLAKYLTQK